MINKYKKIVIMILLLFLGFMYGCEKKYDGEKVKSISFKQIINLDSTELTYNIDFEKNIVSGVAKRYNDIKKEFEESSLDLVEFNDEEETILINKIYNAGFFNLKDGYFVDEKIDDGFSWRLKIVYQNSEQEAYGINSTPQELIDSSYAFYDFSGYDILCCLPLSYYYPQELFLSFEEKYNNTNFESNITLFPMLYTWNGSVEEENVLYENIPIPFGFITNESRQYKLNILSKNMECKYKKLIVKSYDLNYNGGIVVATFKKNIDHEVDIEINRIYEIEATFDNDNVCTYMFKTLAEKEQMLYGVYEYKKDDLKLKLSIARDNSFSFEVDGKTKHNLSGSFKINQNRLILEYDSNEVVFDIVAHGLIFVSSKNSIGENNLNESTLYFYESSNGLI